MTENDLPQPPHLDLPKAYQPRKTELRIYRAWMESGLFAPRAKLAAAGKAEPPFVIALPPPNITGELHLGHALCYLIQDIAGRRARMRGRPTLLLPGLDHAGIATQNVVERQLASEGLSRHDLGRERFQTRCWAFVNTTTQRIRAQFQRLGFSYDWSRERFTLDEGYRQAVNQAFAHFFRKGWIYRGNRLVNWCPRCATSVSDLEVEHVKRRDTLYTIKYPILSSESCGDELAIAVATTRPETMLGDTAVAVHPQDQRYVHLVGHTAVLPLIGRRLPIIADDAVDPGFGTGAVKVTPAHDPTDNDLGARHELESISVIGEDGRMTVAAGPFAEFTTSECRKALLEALARDHLLIKQEPYEHRVGTCERCHTVIEPFLSRQWFLNMEHLAGPGIDAVKSGRVVIVPKRWERVYVQWMENIHDWCISRQLWWGHRIPIWICSDCDNHNTLSEDGSPPAACEICESSRLVQETDVLDTWFSSALWPFASLGWPKNTEDLQRYYPGTLLGTAGEIIFLWVARMIMEGIEFTGQEPFSQVYINPTVLAADGRRMSKSLGTGVDPLIACDEFGADAIRWALIRDNTMAQAVRFSETRAAKGRRFANKLWNAGRFVLEKSERPALNSADPADDLTLPDRWIRSRLNATIGVCDAAYEALRFDLAAQALYEFVWGDYCDWYLEIAKHRLEYPATQFTLRHCLDRALRLLHPLMPFVTEEIWTYLQAECNEKKSEALIVAKWPNPERRDLEAEDDMAHLLELIRRIRNARAVQRVPQARRVPANIAIQDRDVLFTENLDWVAPLACLDRTQLAVLRADAYPEHPSEGATQITVGPYTCYLLLVDRPAERERLNDELERLSQRITHSEELMAGEFSRRAPAEVVERERERLAHMRSRRQVIREQLGR